MLITKETVTEELDALYEASSNIIDANLNFSEMRNEVKAYYKTKYPEMSEEDIESEAERIDELTSYDAQVFKFADEKEIGYAVPVEGNREESEITEDDNITVDFSDVVDSDGNPEPYTVKMIKLNKLQYIVTENRSGWYKTEERIVHIEFTEKGRQADVCVYQRNMPVRQ